MTESEVDKLITFFRDANKHLRKRAITIGILMIVTISLAYMESARLERVTDLLNYEYKLEKVKSLNDTSFKKVIDGNDAEYFPLMERCSSCYEHKELFEKIQANNYDRKVIVDALIQINARIDEVNREKYVNIIGFTIPIEPLYYVFFIVMLILFHDFTQVITYRKSLYLKIKSLKIADWKLGFELFGFYGMPL